MQSEMQSEMQPAMQPETQQPEIRQPQDANTVDLDRIEQDLADVDVALQRLDAGTYFTDEITGQPMSDEVLARNPVARRNS